jgi:hypothetical protein
MRTKTTTIEEGEHHHSAEAIAEGDVVVPGTLPSCRWLRHDDSFVIIQLFPTGLLYMGIHSKSGQKTKSGPGKKSGSGGRPSNPDFSQKDKKVAV